jgi:cellulose synthase (UDP-forming)
VRGQLLLKLRGHSSRQDREAPAPGAGGASALPYFAQERVALPEFLGGERPAAEPRRVRWWIRGIALAAVIVTYCYLVWRITSTVDLSVWWVSIPLMLAELHNGVGLTLYTLSLWNVDAGPSSGPVEEADGTVALLLTTYQEPVDVLLPAIAAAVAVDVEHETWVLDDGNRLEVKRLADDLGARYLAREENVHAKAGNLNHAIERIEADYYAILDADHVAQPDFLRNTLGYFRDPKVAVVQTPQDFYNLESFEHEGTTQADHRPYNEEAIFYRVIAPGKNHWNAAFWCGTGAVVRGEALRDVGLVATETVTEDIQTSMRMNVRGWKSVYHNEVLARGLAPSDASQYMLQRHRWAMGAMQVLRQERPLTSRGMTLGQRLAFATTLFGWFDSWRTFAFIVIPIGVVLTGASPINARGEIYGPAFLATFVIQFAGLRMLARGYYPPITSLLFEMLRLPAVLPATLVLLTGGRGIRFVPTPKGASEDRRRTPVPVMLQALLAGCALGLVWFPATLLGLTPTVYDELPATIGAMFFMLMNFALLVMAVRRVRNEKYAGNRRGSVRFPVRLIGAFESQSCEVEDLSTTGAQILLVDGKLEPIGETGSLDLVLPDGSVARVNCEVRRRAVRPDGVELGLEFDPADRRAAAAVALSLLHRRRTAEELGVVFPTAA